ncbi:major facilitator superfamily domain-containing protein [Cladorrhinum sp. PSN259]|nr:major facilitator superfamily domain-containing protein [Cladorrhinum sp. PSN259]
MSSSTGIEPLKEPLKEDVADDGTTSPSQNAPSPPDGGLVAWLQVLGAFFLNFNTWGLLNTFGLFQASYSTLHPHWTSSQISWLGSTQAFLMLFTCVLSGRLLDAGYFRTTLVTGILLSVLGMQLTSISTKYIHFILSQSVCVGIGLGMVFIPSITLVGQYFSSRRATAMGLAAAGSSVGGIVYPILLNHLIEKLDIRWATRILGFCMLGTLLVPLAIMRPLFLVSHTTTTVTTTISTSVNRQKKPAVLKTRRRPSAAFATWLLAVFFIFTGLYIPFFYIETISSSSYALTILNASSIPGRILPSILADRVQRLGGPLAVMIPSVFLSGAVTLIWVAAYKSATGNVLVAVFLGLASGAIQAVLPAQVPRLCPDLATLGANMGMTMFASGVGLLLGGPVAGVILDGQSGKGHDGNEKEYVYWGMLSFAGVTIILGGGFLVVVWWMMRKADGRSK